MFSRTPLLVLFPLLAILGTTRLAAAVVQQTPQNDGLRALDGEWLYVEDRTEGRPVEQHQPSMSTKFRLRVEAEALVVVRRDGEIRMPLDGSPVEVPGRSEGSRSRYHGAWKDGVYEYVIEMLRGADAAPSGLIRTEFRVTPEGMVATVAVDPPDGFRSVALYRHPQDIPKATPAKATIADLAWLAGAWIGTRGTAGTTSIEERWSPPLGGAMLGVSRTVVRGRMTAFEYLRIVERDGGLVYVAQPGGSAPTEFVLTEFDKARAVFENPRHDFPQRIVYELAQDGSLSASIGFLKGGRPQRFEWRREAD